MYRISVFLEHLESVIPQPSGFYGSDKKSAVNLTEDPLCAMNHFSPDVFKMSSLSLNSLTMICLGVDL